MLYGVYYLKYVICAAAAVFLTRSQQHVVDVLAVAAGLLLTLVAGNTPCCVCKNMLMSNSY